MPPRMARRSAGLPKAPADGARPEPLASPGRPVPRLVQRSGPTTLVVSLPKSWVEKEGIHPGQAVSWMGGDEGELRLIPPQRSSHAAEPRLFRVHARHLDSPDTVQRVLRSAYVLGFDHIQIQAEQGIAEEVRAAAEQTARELLGFTLTEATSKSLVATSFLDPGAHPVAEVITRVGYTLDLFLERLERGLEEGPSKALQKASDMRVEVRRLHALALRQLNLASQDPRLARQLGVARSSHLLGTRVVVRLLDDIADAVEAAASALGKMRRPPTSTREVLGDLQVRVASLRENLRRSLRALRSESPSQAEAAIEPRQEAIDAWLRTDAKLRRMAGKREVRHSLSLCSWWIGVARQHAATIAELAFTRSLDRSPSELELQ
ncbi:MAG: hypothetical protein KGJ23_13425 [Euryarchaeota archaeon]|nr:hypothetical protein [Euryarchaeota archaeon]MDE1837600.1 hypothetical protein [Euryarchaeota archaeon]MDE1881253.1 hypothetical protein [Euryarchaeota archaeon]MDE2045911.1 hypothetical protein [Thermoplasmata archaeon]